MNSLIYSRKIDYAAKQRSFVYQEINSIFFLRSTPTYQFNNSRIKVQDDALYQAKNNLMRNSKKNKAKNCKQKKKFEWNLLALLI